ncbi:MAG TPA: acyltransferase family protein [Patescibacteria group bacterium]|nr:acyltransferase family protein [Patescibacteria group bacterium]
MSDSLSESVPLKAIPKSERFYFLDHLRGAVIFWVILHHVAIGYGILASKWWYVADTQRNSIFDWFVCANDIFMMPVMFFVAGYFGLLSLNRHSVSHFWKSKLLRIVLPWIGGVLLLAPLFRYMTFFSRPPAPPFFQFWPNMFFQPQIFDQSHFWFLGLLAWFYLFLTILCYCRPSLLQPHSEPVRPSLFLFFSLCVFCAITIFGAMMVTSRDAWINNLYIVAFQPSRLLEYAAYFACGCFAWRCRWFYSAGGYIPHFQFWLSAAVVTLMAFLAYRVSIPVFSTPATKAIYALLHSFFCLSMFFFLMSAFQRFFNRPASPVITQWCNNSYQIYFIHQLIVLPLAYLVQPFLIASLIKFIAVAGCSVLLSYLLALLLNSFLKLLTSKQT